MHFLKPSWAANGYVKNESKPGCNVSSRPVCLWGQRKKPIEKMKRSRLLRNVNNFCSENGLQWMSPFSYLLEFWRRGNFFSETLEIYIRAITSAMCGLPWKTTSCIRIRKEKEQIFPELWRLSIGAFANLECNCVLRHICPHGTPRFPLDGFAWQVLLEAFRRSFEKMEVWLKYDKNNGYFTWIRMSIYDISMRNFSVKIYMENQTTNFMYINFFSRKSSPLWDNV
jgi:hypothetical protein